MILNTQCIDIGDICICYVAVYYSCCCWLQCTDAHGCEDMYLLYIYICLYILAPRKTKQKRKLSLVIAFRLCLTSFRVRFYLYLYLFVSLSLSHSAAWARLFLFSFLLQFNLPSVWVGSVQACAWLRITIAEYNIQCNFPFMQIWKSIFGLCMRWNGLYNKYQPLSIPFTCTRVHKKTVRFILFWFIRLVGWLADWLAGWFVSGSHRTYLWHITLYSEQYCSKHIHSCIAT